MEHVMSLFLDLYITQKLKHVCLFYLFLESTENN